MKRIKKLKHFQYFGSIGEGREGGGYCYRCCILEVVLVQGMSL